MSPEAIKNIIQKGEGIQVEFKRAGFRLPENVFESVCAMLNRQGGHLLLGVTNDGGVEGVIEGSVPEMKAAFVSSVNNTEQLNPKYYLNIHDVLIDGKTILYSYIPESSQVHSYLGNVYDRNEDGDFDISNNPDLVRQLHLKKQGSFSENTIYPAITLPDLRSDLIQRSRTLANNNKPGHPWMELNDEQMLRFANLWKKDWKTGEEGFTLAAALLLGKDEVIRQIVPHYKTDAILKRENTDRYDDREIVITNLIESYDKLMAFIAKHLPDKFQMEGDQRISVRDKLFREVVANTLIHREFINEYPARLIITKTEVSIQNWNRPHGSGRFRLDTYSPFPKNPVIAAFFREIGRAEELGSGYRNSERFTRIYTNGGEPLFEEGDIFRTIIPLGDSFGPATDSSKAKDEGVKPEADRAIDRAKTKVEGVNSEVEGVNRVVEGVNSEVEGVNREVDGVNPEVGKAIDGVIDGVIDETIDGVRSATKEKIATLLKHIHKSEGKRLPEYSSILGIPEKTLEVYISKLRHLELITYIGDSPKTGGYFITDKLKKIINQKSAD